MPGEHPIIHAARRGQLEKLRALLAAGGDLEARDAQGCTALMAAAERGRRAAAALLLEHGAAVNACSAHGDSALTEASRAGDRELVALLLQHGADPNHAPRFGRLALGNAAAAGDGDLCLRLLHHGAEIDREHNGYTALALAADFAQEETALLLIAQGADVDRPAAGENAPLVLAARYGLLRLLARILELTRVPVDDDLVTLALTEAIDREQAAAAQLLLERGCKPDFSSPPEPYVGFPLRQAAYHGNGALVELLLARGARVNERSAAGTALTAAAEQGRLDALERLLAHGADPALTDMYRRTPLEWALLKERPSLLARLLEAGAWPAQGLLDAAFLLIAYTDHVTLAQRLLDGGADARATLTREGLPHGLRLGLDEALLRMAELLGGEADRGDEGTTALMIAAGAGRPAMVEFLLARGAAVEARNGRGDTPLIYAAGGDALAVVRRLLGAGAAVDAVNGGGCGAVHSAAGSADPAILALLLERGAAPDRADEEGWTPLMQALRENRAANARLLLAHGAAAGARCADGYTTLMAAARGGCAELLHELVAGGADLHARWQEEDRDALMLAALDGRAAVVRSLLELGADPRAVNRHGESAIALAQAENHTEVARLLAAAGASPAPERERRPLPWPDADYCRRLVAQLQRNMPELDPAAMLAALPDAQEGGPEEALLHWLHRGLAAQDLMRYAEWKSWWGDLPELQPLETLALGHFSAQPLLDLMEKEGWPEFPWDAPCFEYQNHFLAPHGLHLATLACENIYVMCLRADADAVAALAQVLGEGGITLVQHPPMDLRQCREALRARA